MIYCTFIKSKILQFFFSKIYLPKINKLKNLNYLHEYEETI